MKKLNYIIIALLLAITWQINNAQEQEPEWARVLQLSTYGNQTGLTVTADDDWVYMAGAIYGPVSFEGYSFVSSGFNDMILAKVSNTGVTSWAQHINVEDGGTITPYAIQVDADGNVYVSGVFSGSISVGMNTVYAYEGINAFMTKFSSNGNGLWITSFGAWGNGPTKMVVDDSGNSFLISLGTKFLKFNNSGVIQWEQNYPNNTLHAIAIDSSKLFLGGSLQLGFTSFGDTSLMSANSNNTAFLIKSNLDGMFSGAMVGIHGTDPKSTKEGTYYASGTFNHPTNGIRVISISKLLTGLAEDSLATTIGDLTAASGNVILTINPDFSVTIGGTCLSETNPPVVATSGQENRYDPLEGKFYLNYQYTLSSGTRYISEVLRKTSSSSSFGSTIADIKVADDGNLVVVGTLTSSLTMNNITMDKSASYYYNFIARCDNNFYFEWANASNSLVPQSEVYNFRYRLFIDETGKMYEHGIITNTFYFGSVQITPNNGQFLLRFDSAGNPELSFTLQNTPSNRLYVTSSGKIIRTGNYNLEGSPSYGNLFLTQYDNSMTEEWNIYSVEAQSGSPEINYIKHDTLGNTYVQGRILGSCDFFGTPVSVNKGVTINAKLDINGDVLWSNLISDSLPAQSGGSYFGPRFTIDKDQNLLAVGLFSKSVTVGTDILTNLDGEKDGYVVKYSQDGEIAWVVQLHAQGEYEIYGIAADEENNVIISGEFNADMTVLDHTISSSDLDAAFLIKLDPGGNYIWAQGFPIGGTVFHSIPAVDCENNIYIALDIASPENQLLTFGTVSTPQPELEATVLVKFDADGNAQWVNTYAAVSGDPNSTSWPVDIKTDAEGNSFLWGWCQSNAAFGSTILVNPLSTSMFYYISKINTSGEVVWAEPIYEKNYCFNYGDLLDFDEDGNVYVGGHFWDTIMIENLTFKPENNTDFFVSKFNDAGEFQWIKTLPVGHFSAINAISVFQNNILSVAGDAGGITSVGENEIIRLGGTNCIIATLVGDVQMLLVTPGEIYLDAQASSHDTIHIITNTDWTASCDQTWLTLSSTSGTEEERIILTATENTSVNDRYAIITVTGTGVETQYVMVTQAGNETSTNDINNSSDFIIYPNPNHGRFNLLLDNGTLDDIRITITNSAGVVIKDFNLTQKSEKINQEIDSGTLVKGLYFIHLQSIDSNITRMFIVN